MGRELGSVDISGEALGTVLGEVLTLLGVGSVLGNADCLSLGS